MAVSFTKKPSDAYAGPRPAGQKLIYTLYDATTPDRYWVEVSESDSITGTGTSLGKVYLTPNAAGVAHFDLSDFVEGRVGAPTEDSAGDLAHELDGMDKPASGTAIRRYIVDVGQYNSGTESSTEATDSIYLCGGVEQISSGLDASFVPYYPLGASSLTWLTDYPPTAPLNKYVDIYMSDEDEGVAALINTLFLGQSTFLNKVRVQLYDPGNILVGEVTNTVSSGLAVSDNMNLVPLGPANMAAYFGGTWSANWERYVITPVQSNGTTAVGIGIRVYRDCRPYKHDAVQLAWTNTRGGWDYLRFDGRNLKSVNTETKSYRQTVGTYGTSTFAFNSWDRQTTPYHVTGKETYQLRNRYFSAKERDVLQYAFRSKDVMYRVGTGDWLPCTIQTNSYTVQPAASQLFDVSFNIELSQDIRC
jgi:hypothetical protein